MAREQIEGGKIKQGMVVVLGGKPTYATSDSLKTYGYDSGFTKWYFYSSPSGYLEINPSAKYTHLTGSDRVDFVRRLGIDAMQLESVVREVGADPEIFAVDGRGSVIPAWEWLPEDTKRNAIFWDGFQAEFRVPHGHCLEEGGKAISERLGSLEAALHGKFPNGRLTMKSVVKVPERIRREAEEKYVQLGCQPSVNVYDMHGEPVPDGRALEHRFAGGHIHFGVSKKEVDVARAIKFLDATLAVVGVSLFKGYEDPIRRRYYGLPGEHRVKHYGFEYRTLPNTWLCHPVIYMLTFELARFFVCLSAADLEDLWQADHGEVMRCLMGSDARLAHKILKQNRELLEKFFGSRWPGYAPSLFEALLKGVDGIVKNPEAVVVNWRMTGNWPTFIRDAKGDIFAGRKI